LYCIVFCYKITRTSTLYWTLCLDNQVVHLRLPILTSNLNKAHETRDSLSSFYSQVVQVYFQPRRHNSLLKCAPRSKIAKKTLKPSILGVQGHSWSSMLTLLKSWSLVLVMISIMSVSIWHCFHAKRVNSGKIATFWSGRSRLWLSLAQASLNIGGRDLECWNLRLMLKISCAGCLGPSPAISLQFTLKMCRPKSRKIH